MAIKPIDLQALFLQLGKVGKEQLALKEGAVLHQSIQGALIQKQQDEAAKSVRRAEDDELQTEDIKTDADASSGRQEGEQHREESDEKKPDKETIKDPALGGHIDITG
ncbi:MAG: hypothetical protein ABIJ86_07360 [Spirochaetota bacterium]